MDEKTLKTNLPMACFHGDGNAAEIAAAHARVIEILGLDDKMQKSFVSQIVYALSAWFSPGWEISTVYADMWMLLTVKQSWGEGHVINIECDLLEDGLAILFLHVYDNYERDE